MLSLQKSRCHGDACLLLLGIEQWVHQVTKLVVLLEIAGMLSALFMIWQNWAQTSKHSVAKVQSKAALVRFLGLKLSKRPAKVSSSLRKIWRGWTTLIPFWSFLALCSENQKTTEAYMLLVLLLWTSNATSCVLKLHSWHAHVCTQYVVLWHHWQVLFAADVAITSFHTLQPVRMLLKVDWTSSSQPHCQICVPSE